MKEAISVCALAHLAQAREFAERHSLPCLPSCAPKTWNLCFTETRVELQAPAEMNMSPVYVDFVGGRVGFRRAQGGGTRQPLARAAGIRSGPRPRVLDATAGLGRDAMVMAQLGCHVTLIERSPIIAMLLDDGLRRARACADTMAIAARMHLHGGTDARTYLTGLEPGQFPDVIYLDPMYPHREKSALVKKEMRVLRAVVGDDDDATELLHCARLVALRRVVVKRPKGAPPVADAPDAVVQGENTRYDIYLSASPQ